MAEKKKMSVAEILAAARAQAGGGSPAQAAPAESAESQEASSAEAPTVAAEKPAAAKAPAKAAAGGARPSVAEILAAARANKPGAEAAKPAAAAKPAVAKPAEKPARAEPAKQGGPTWCVQFGSTPNRADADKLAATLSDYGYSPYVVSADIPGKGVYYRVRVGRFEAKAGADKLRADATASHKLLQPGVVMPAR